MWAGQGTVWPSGPSYGLALTQVWLEAVLSSAEWSPTAGKVPTQRPQTGARTGSPRVEDLRAGKQARDIFISSSPVIQPALLGEGNLRKHVHSGGKKRNKRAGWEHKEKHKVAELCLGHFCSEVMLNMKYRLQVSPTGLDWVSRIMLS